MSYKDIATPSRTREIMEQYGLSVKKSLGQNFLVDVNILDKIMDVSTVDKHTNVIEIGPGIGALTEQIARNAKHVVAFEIDNRLIPILEDTLSPYNNVSIVHGDILEVELKETLQQYIDLNERLLVIANLPYYITTPIIMKLLEADIQIDGFTMMMQKEVAQRMTASPNTKAYGSLTVAIAYHCHAEIGFIVPKTVFNPPPNIDSAILVLKKRSQPLVQVEDEEHFFTLVRNSFVQRRKTLWNNLKVYMDSDEKKKTLEKALEEVGISPSVRAEALDIEAFAKLSDAMVKNNIK